MALTDIAIKKAKSGAKPIKVSDEKGLYLLLNPTGSKLWRWKYRVDGAEKTHGAGQLPRRISHGSVGYARQIPQAVGDRR